MKARVTTLSKHAASVIEILTDEAEANDFNIEGEYDNQWLLDFGDRAAEAVEYLPTLYHYLSDYPCTDITIL